MRQFGRLHDHCLDDVQPLRKELEGEDVGGGIPLPHRGVFAFWGFKLSDLVHIFR